MSSTILVVDDEVDVTEAVREVLEDDGFSVVSCTSGDQCLPYLSRSPDLVLLDVMMPGTSGLDLLKMMRSDPELENIPVILMSAIRPSVSQQEYGWQVFLQKPFSLKTLTRRVRELLDTRS